LLDASLPAKNRDDKEGEDYADLLDDLLHFRIDTTNQLRDLIKKHMKSVLKDEHTHVVASVAEMQSGLPLMGTDQPEFLYQFH
jgi:hypothetical protein